MPGALCEALLYAREWRELRPIFGGTAGLGRDLAALCLERGQRVVIAGRDEERCAGIASELHPECESLAIDLADPESMGAA